MRRVAALKRRGPEDEDYWVWDYERWRPSDAGVVFDKSAELARSSAPHEYVNMYSCMNVYASISQRMTPSGLGILRVFPGERVGQARPLGQRARVSAPRWAQGFRIDESKPNRWFPKYDPTDGKPPAELRASLPPCPAAHARGGARGPRSPHFRRRRAPDGHFHRLPIYSLRAAGGAGRRPQPSPRRGPAGVHAPQQRVQGAGRCPNQA